MKRGFTLIELIISIVVIAITFAVIPKIIYITKKSQAFIKQEDALFNGVSLISIVLKLPWDENNTMSNAILRVDSRIFDCNSSNLNNEPASFYRVGGFIGSRSCIDYNATLKASTLGKDNLNFDDIDDYKDYEQNSTDPITGNSIYGFKISVDYLKDDIVNYDFTNQSAIVNISNIVKNQTTNIKRVKLSITYQGKRVINRGDTISSFLYYSANIGQTYIRERLW